MRSPILALDSSTATGSIAVGDGDRLLAEITLNVTGGSSAAIMPAVDLVVRRAGLESSDLRGVAVSGGPGSFTGVRIAAATAKGVAHALGVPLFAYSGLMVAAGGCLWGVDGEVCAMFDARRGDVYWGVYGFSGMGGPQGEGDGEGEERPGTGTGTEGDERPGTGTVRVVRAPSASGIDEVIEWYREREAPVFVGEGAVIHRDVLQAELGGRVVPLELSAPRAAVLLWLVRVAPEMGLVEDAAAWEPDYVRASGAERIAAAAKR